ncbi:glutathione binding-like protein [Paraburkholderia acidisoli]|uniref:Glutathione S-transferase n=1 Tax=Paraburkholderia acidisoli TaxID=2571748 RepID=A0A7Z2JGR2_9BURK|nr:glutathione binding-like protein [Paraburkholderia acidisoli]QGZ64011.1 glutathione S-transferase [Paraburkholderia acidisoli]
MDLYFAPLACSLATRIALYEADADADTPINYIQVDTSKKTVVTGNAAGSDFFGINAMGQVPVLREDDGWTLTENAAVLPYVADRFPAARLAPPAGTRERARLHQWLGFIGTELHKGVFVPLLARETDEAVKAYARAKVPRRFNLLEHHLDTRLHLLDTFSVADAYLVVVLNWAPFVGVDLSQWEVLADYARRVRERPAVARAFADEYELFRRARAS